MTPVSTPIPPSNHLLRFKHPDFWTVYSSNLCQRTPFSKAAPTQPQQDVFKVMSGRLDDQLTKWAQIKTDEVVKINDLIKQADLPALTVASGTAPKESPTPTGSPMPH